MKSLKGKEALIALAGRFPQLYVAPTEGAQEAHRAASALGIVFDGANLDHFTGSPEDELREVDTPAGPVEVLFLKQRGDFETFLQIIGHKSSPAPIARTVGAITYRGIPDWGKVAQAKETYLASGGDDWSGEFARLAKVPGAFKSELIVISEGPYSNIAATSTPFGSDEWLRVSREIRLNHECGHVVCRRTMPDDILPVWDEVTADVVGLVAATGRYDASLAALFLGVSDRGFSDGRLVEYLSEDQMPRLDEIAVEVHGTCTRIEQMCGADEAADPFAFLLDLKRNPMIGY